MYLENLRHSTTPTSVVAPILAGFRLRPLRLTPLCCPTRFMFYLVDFNNLNNWQQLPRSSALCCVPVAGGLPCVVQRKGLPSRVGFPLPWWLLLPLLPVVSLVPALPVHCLRFHVVPFIPLFYYPMFT